MFPHASISHCYFLFTPLNSLLLKFSLVLEWGLRQVGVGVEEVNYPLNFFLKNHSIFFIILRPSLFLGEDLCQDFFLLNFWLDA